MRKMYKYCMKNFINYKIVKNKNNKTFTCKS